MTTPKPQPPSRSNLRAILAGVLLLALAFIAYRPAADGPFNWDDSDYVWSNPTLRSLSGLGQIWLSPTASPQYYPMVFTTFWLESRLWNFEPHGYREVNILLHGLSAILLWRLLKRLQVPGALFAAAIFAVHPVMIESVAWITERKNTLSLVFYLLAMHSALRPFGVIAGSEKEGTKARRHEGTKGEENQTSQKQRTKDQGPRTTDQSAIGNPQSAMPYLLSLSFFLLALFSKTVTATLSAALAVILWWKSDRFPWRKVLLLIPFFLLGLGASFVTGYLERTHVGASGPEWDFTLPQRILIAGRAVWFYVAKDLFPTSLSFIYPRWTIDPHALWQWLYPAALVIVLAALWLFRKRLGRGPLAGALLFVGTLVPALGFLNVFPMRYSFVADHFQYHASIALIATICAGLTIAFRRLMLSKFRTQSAAFAPVLAASALVIVLLIAAWSRAAVYATRESLWEDARAKNPNSWMIHTQLGHLAMAQSPPDLAKARPSYEKALHLAPERFETHLDFGNLLLQQKDFAAAESQLLIAQKLEPRHAGIYTSLGLVYRAQNKLDAAIDQFKQALARSPDLYYAHYWLAVTLDQKGDLPGAIAEFKEAVRCQPDAVSALERLAFGYIRSKRYPDAETCYRQILDLAPENAEAHFNLSKLLALTGRMEEAAQHRAKAMSLNPSLGG